MTSLEPNSGAHGAEETEKRSSGPKPSYAEAGIADLSEFYATKFASTEILDPRYFRPLDRFDMHFARTLWVYDNVREGASLLDIGCGVGLLALLKRKRVRLSGVDVSDVCVEAAKINGYDDVRRGELSNLPFDDASFDYVASLDVLGHVSFEEKDQVLAEIKRVLKPDGVTLHGIECTDAFTHKAYSEMTPDELKRFAEVDGHIGLERADEHAARFGKFFSHVLFEPRYVLCLSSEEFLKQADDYGLPFEPDFLKYVRGLSHGERRAFDMAMGYVFNKISDLHIKLPDSGLYTFLKAANVELGPFYNEHRDRKDLIPLRDTQESGADNDTAEEDEWTILRLDHTATADDPINAEFDNGWYPPDDLPPVSRWMRRHAKLTFTARSLASVSLVLVTHMPDVGPARPLDLAFLLNGELIGTRSLQDSHWTRVRFEVPGSLRSAPQDTFELTIHVSRTFQPNLLDPKSADDRELSIAVNNIEIRVRK